METLTVFDGACRAYVHQEKEEERAVLSYFNGLCGADEAYLDTLEEQEGQEESLYEAVYIIPNKFALRG